MKKFIFLLALAGLAGCSDKHPAEQYEYTCTVDRVEGTFLSSRYHIKASSRMITMYRFTNGKKRTFMFPAERIACSKTTGENNV